MVSGDDRIKDGSKVEKVQDTGSIDEADLGLENN